ncbi:MAG: sulfite exporter TauE/SafE family protein, partial [Elusimicrobia bacterium]|nr:sulfite exporter TauE/SafE family protein [Elusimicrobiota bacterium]
MPGVRGSLLASLAVVAAVFAGYWGWKLLKERHLEGLPGGPVRRPTWRELALGFLTDFFDTLGIGSYAPTTTFFKLFRMVPDEDIPGTLNIGHAVPTFAEALIFIAIVQVEGRTLLLMILASVVGAWLGAGVVTRWPRRNIQVGMGAALLAAAVFFVMKNMGLFPAGGEGLGLHGAALAVGVAGNFVLGALMTLGIGAYAPCMILTSLLGMNVRAAFPIMMGSCAFLMPAANIRFIASGRYSRGPALGLTLGGTPAVLIAAYIVKSLPLTTLRWL